MKRFSEPVLVTRPFLPPLADFMRGCEAIWANRWLTNNGPMVLRFHSALAAYLDVPETNIALFSNGTSALECGYQALGLDNGDVITTPFTFVATAHALKRVGATPIFADIDPDTLCLSPASAERLITSRTKAIVPVHVYGTACDVDGFRRLGEKYGVKIVYDAAHAFGTGLHHHGDMSMLSFHATKLFHSCEGGCLVFRDAALQERLFNLRNFAIRNETECVDVGSNAKMNELSALMGIECLKHIDAIQEYRKRIFEAYRESFAGVDAVRLFPHSMNKAYCPILFHDFATRERVYEELKKANIFTRRYFYPLLTDFAPYIYGRESCPVARQAASRILALPTYHDLAIEDAKSIAQNILEIIG